jgi:arabinogalactan endo-1,4-beta-galactosidase
MLPAETRTDRRTMKEELNHRGTEGTEANSPFRTIWQSWPLCLCASVVAFLILANGSLVSAEAAEHWISGADISALPMMEKAGGVFRDHGKAEDAIAIFRAHGCNLFRIRLFVDPQTDPAKSYGAIQNLPYVTALAQRVKAAGGKFLLDIHYSDTWADPAKQFTPKRWEGLDFKEMKKQVGEYTTSVLNDLDKAGVRPDMVQVGNEITSGMLWPAGKVWKVPADKLETQWAHFAALFNAGAAAVRKFDGGSHSIRIVLHIDGGGKEGRTKWFLNKIVEHPFDYDVLGLSFYPAWGDSIDALKQNMADAIFLTGKDVLIAETSYPWHPLPDIPGGTKIMRWPTTPIGQKAFMSDLIALLKTEPDGHGLGFVYWYPEAISLPGMRVWRQGYEALFDQDGNALPAMEEMKKR